MDKHARSVVWTLCLLFSALPAAAQFSSGSSGVHGPFPPIPTGQTGVPQTAGVALLHVKSGLVRYCSAYDNNNRPETCITEVATAQLPGIPTGGLTTGVFEFTNFDNTPGTGVGATGRLDLYFVGNDINVPITILSQADIRIKSDIHADGLSGKTSVAIVFGGVGGRGGPGGYTGGSGGNGGATPANGNAGLGPAGGAGGTVSTTSVPTMQGANAGSSPASLTLTPVTGGSGGGGAAGSIASNPLNCGTNAGGYGGGGGGGGGGALLLVATNEIAVAGSVIVTGGAGGSNFVYTGCVLQGGGAEGGSIRLVAKTVSGGASIFLGGGSGDGATTGAPTPAPGGRIRIEAFINSFTGGINGASSGSFIQFPSPVTPSNMPTLKITSVGGVTVANPTGSFLTPDVNFSSPPTNPVTVQLSASNIPVGTTVALRAVPLVGAPTAATSSALAGTLASSTASASLNIPPGYGSITAAATFTASALALPGPVFSSLPKIDGKAAERFEVVTTAGGESKLFAIAANGKRIEISPNGGWSFGTTSAVR